MPHKLLYFFSGDRRHIQMMFPPPVFSKNGQRLHTMIKEYLKLLRTELDEYKIPRWGIEYDGLCYQIAKLFYDKIGELMGFDFPVSEMEPESRHRFFVATEPFDHPEEGFVLGLSELEDLLGIRFLPKPSESTEATASESRTTGDEDLDVATSALLIFKHNGLDLCSLLGVDELHRMCVLAGKLQSVGDDEEIEEAFESPIIQSPDFTENREAIVESLSGLKVELPPDF